jgi:hypothetical protein
MWQQNIPSVNYEPNLEWDRFFTSDATINGQADVLKVTSKRRHPRKADEGSEHVFL